MASTLPSRADVVVGVDFGMTSTGVAFSVGPEWIRPETIQNWPGAPGGGLADKVDTALAYDIQTDEVATWGFTVDLDHKGFRIEEMFKLYLDPQYQDSYLEAPSFKEARRWYTDYLSCVYQHIIRAFTGFVPRWNEKQVDFLFSVPASWKNPAMISEIEQLIRSAGFGSQPNHNLEITLTEAEAAAVYVSKNVSQKGDVFLVCDAGGGTTDVNILKRTSATIDSTELEPLLWVEGSPIGSTLIDFKIENNLTGRLESIRHRLEAEPRVIAQKMMRERFEHFKCNFGYETENASMLPLIVPGLRHNQRFPAAEVDDSKMYISREELQSAFDEQVERIFKLVDEQLRSLQKSHPRETVDYLVLSGGLGSSPYVRERIRMRYEMGSSHFPNIQNMKILSAAKPQLAVVHGLVMDRIQHIKEGSIVYMERCSRNSYGIVVRKLYNPSIHQGEVISIDPRDKRKWAEKQIYWFIQQGSKISVREGLKHRFHLKIDPGKERLPWKTHIVISSLPPSQLPKSLRHSGVEPVCAIESVLSEHDMKLKNRHWYNFGPQYYRAEFDFRVIVGTAGLMFEITGKDGVVSKTNDMIEVKWEPSVNHNAFANLPQESLLTHQELETETILAKGYEMKPFGPPRTPRRVWYDLETSFFGHVELDTHSSLGDLVILVGELNDAWCTTCSEYLRWKWPSTGLSILSIVDKIYRHSLSDFNCSGEARFEDPKISIRWSTSLKVDPTDTWTLEIESDGLHGGSKQLFNQIAIVLHWMSCVLYRVKEDYLHTSENVFSEFESSGYRIPKPKTRRITANDQTCWLPLFPHKVVAAKFPIPPRPPEMRGLEIPFELMVSLAGIDVPVIEDGGIRLEGYYTILYPILYDIDTASCNYIQWHLFSASKDEREDHEALARFKAQKPPTTWYRTKLFRELYQAKRHFLGWCSHALLTLGTPGHDYVGLSWTGAEIKEKSTVESSTVLNLGLSSHGIGLSVGRTWKRARNERNPFEDRVQNFVQTILLSKKQQILLYHWKNRQAWLVPKVSVLLHLVITSMHQMVKEDPNLEFQYPFAELDDDGGKKAYEVLKAHRNDLLPLGEPEAPYYLRDLANMFLYAFDKLARRSSSTLISYKVQGWELMDLIVPPQYFDYVQDSISFALLGGWTKLLPKIPLVLFYDAMDDPIIPGAQSRICRSWKRMPAHVNYLGATISSIKDFAERYRELSSRGRLTDTCFWHSDVHPFQQCRNHCQSCQRLQWIRLTETKKTQNSRTTLNQKDGTEISLFNDPSKGWKKVTDEAFKSAQLFEDCPRILTIKSISDILTQIEGKINRYDVGLKQLGINGLESDAAREKVQQGCDTIAELARDGVRGVKDNRFGLKNLNSNALNDGHASFVRSNIKDLVEKFARSLRINGHNIVFAWPHTDTSSNPEAWVDKVLFVLNRMQGNEVKTQVDPASISLLFQDYSIKWKQIAGGHITRVGMNLDDFLKWIVNTVPKTILPELVQLVTRKILNETAFVT